jgi:hypothetical protein
VAEELRYKFTGDGGSLARTLADTADKADKAGDALDDLAADAAKLDTEIATLRTSMRDTARDIARTADEAERKNLFKVLAQQKRQMGRVVRARDLIDFTPEEVTKLGARMAAALGEGVSRAGGPIADALGNVFGALPPQAQAAIGAGVVAAVAAAAPAAAAVVTGAVSGGIAAGGVAAGVALAARDARVKAAAEGLGDTILDALARSAAPAFVPPVLDAIATIRVEVRDLDDELDDMFGAAARNVDPFVRGLVGGAKAALPGFTEGLERSHVAAEAFADGMIELGDAVGDSIALISQASAGGGQAIEDLFVILEFGVRSISAMITGLTFLYEALRFVTGGAAAQTEIISKHAVAAADAKNPLDGLAEAFRGIGEEQGEAADTARELDEAWDDLFNNTMSADQALVRYEESWDRLIEELNTGKKTLDLGTEAGRNNMNAVLDQIEAINGLREAGLINDQQYEDHLGTLQATLIKRGFEAAAVQRIIDKYRNIPSQVQTLLKNNAVPATSRVEEYIRKLGDIPSTRTVTIIQRLVQKGVRIAGLTGPGGVTAFSKGGVVEGPGPRGVDSVPALLAPREGVLTEAGLERLGGPQMLHALNKGLPLPASAPARSSGPRPLLGARATTSSADLTALAQAFARAVRDELRGVQLAVNVDSRRVGEAQASDGYRKARGEH